VLKAVQERLMLLLGLSEPKGAACLTGESPVATQYYGLVIFSVSSDH